jgi:hypothetical protein
VDVAAYLLGIYTYQPSVLLTHQVKLLPTAEQRTALLEIMERFNEACDFVARVLVNGPIGTVIFQAILVHPSRKTPVSKGRLTNTFNTAISLG